MADPRQPRKLAALPDQPPLWSFSLSYPSPSSGKTQPFLQLMQLAPGAAYRFLSLLSSKERGWQDNKVLPSQSVTKVWIIRAGYTLALLQLNLYLIDEKPGTPNYIFNHVLFTLLEGLHLPYISLTIKLLYFKILWPEKTSHSYGKHVCLSST